MRSAIFVLLLVGLSACATPYQEKTWWNDQGVSGKQLSSDMLLISAKGNALTSDDQVQAYVFRKAAEMTLAAGNDWFRPVTEGDRTEKSVIAGSAGRSFFAFPVIEPGAAMRVKMGKNPKPEDALDAREVIAFSKK